MPDCAVSGYAIGAGQHPGGHVGHARAVCPDIGALIVEEFIVYGENASVRIDRGANPVRLFTRMIAGHQVFAPVFYPFHRPLQAQCAQANQHILGVNFAPHTEAAADMAFIQVDGGGTAPEHACQQVAIGVGPFGRAVQLKQVPRGIVAGDGPPRFQRHTRMPANGNFQFDHAVRRSERGVDVAVGFADDRRFGIQAWQKTCHRRKRG